MASHTRTGQSVVASRSSKLPSGGRRRTEDIRREFRARTGPSPWKEANNFSRCRADDPPYKLPTIPVYLDSSSGPNQANQLSSLGVGSLTVARRSVSGKCRAHNACDGRLLCLLADLGRSPVKHTRYQADRHV